MKNYIFYFSGTGNTLSIARRIAKRFDNTVLINIATLGEETFKVFDANTVGFLFPIYVFREPLIFESFLEQLYIEDCQYIYTLGIHGGSPYNAVNSFIKKLKKLKISCTAGFELLTPDNYIEGLNPPNLDESQTILKESYTKLDDIVKSIKLKQTTVPRKPLHQKVLGNLLSKTFKKTAANAPKRFEINASCNSCGLCEKICPKEVVNLNEFKQPIWSGNKCEMCFSCINYCPQKAIEFGRKTIGRNRYTNPEVTSSDLRYR